MLIVDANLEVISLILFSFRLKTRATTNTLVSFSRATTIKTILLPFIEMIELGMILRDF